MASVDGPARHCPRKSNGSTRPGVVLCSCSIRGALRRQRRAHAGMERATMPARATVKAPVRWGPTRLGPSASRTCQATCGSGCRRTGSRTTTRHLSLRGFVAAGAGAASKKTPSKVPTAPITFPPKASTSSASAAQRLRRGGAKRRSAIRCCSRYRPRRRPLWLGLVCAHGSRQFADRCPCRDLSEIVCLAAHGGYYMLTTISKPPPPEARM